MIKVVCGLLLALSVQSSMAKTVYGEPEGSENLPSAAYGLAAVQEQHTLVQSQKGDSDLRVSLMVTDNGGSTDVSPWATLYLTMFNQSEMKDASSIHKIAQINHLYKVERVRPGVYKAYFSAPPYADMYDGVDCQSPRDYQSDYVATIDARKLSSIVRNFGGAEEFSHKFVTYPVEVKFSCY